MKTKTKINAYILRSSAAALLFSCMIVALSWAINVPNHPAKVAAPQDNTALGVNGHESASSVASPRIQRDRTLTFADRVAYQRAIEEVYWQHRIWPKERPDPKPSLDTVMTQAQLERKVSDYLRNSQALEDYWQRPITPDQLQAEMERMANHTKQPAVLREIFAALGNDAFVIAECLARPVLAERLITELYAHDQRFHGELKRRAEDELRTHRSVRQMKQTSGMYTEMEWIKSERTPDQDKGGSVSPGDDGKAVKMSSSEWQESVQKLAKDFGFGVRRHVAAFESAGMSAHSQNAAPGEYEILPAGKVGPLQEDDEHYYAVAVTKKSQDGLKLATIAWLKEPLRSWLDKAEAQVPVTLAAVSADYTLPEIGSPSVACTDDTWTPTSLTNAPTAREFHTAVWTGSEMIVWGGFPYSNTGGRYNPSTDTWVATSTTHAPAGRESQTAVWTGSEMIVWGGVRGRNYNQQYLSTGGRYNPSTNSWVATSTTNAPAGRYDHTAVWTGSEMIVWGGVGSDYFNTGGRYNPNTNSWTATSTTHAPAGRYDHTAVWTGSEMIVWGGYGGANPANPRFLNTGDRYNPSTDSWTATSTTNAPTARYRHTAVWTGTKMIVWGGSEYYNIYDNTGGRYNPTTNSWTATSTANAPTGRAGHTARWTGSEMIVWGGAALTNFFNTGGRYSPSMDTWTATSTTNAPTGRQDHTAVWTGSEMIVWGGVGSDYFNTGGRYCANGPPLVITNPATLIASFSATLIGSVNPHGLTTTVYFQYGTTTSYGSTTASRTKTGNTYQNVSVNINGLSVSTTYHFRIVATNSAGTRYGSDRTFTTVSAAGPPVVTTNPATLVAGFSATLNGSVDPHGLTTTVYFQYGTTTSYGLTTAIQSKTGNTYQNVVATIGSLTASTTYHFRIVATNSAGTRYGSDRTFTTLSATGAPVVITNPATNVTSSSATLNASVDPHGLTTTVSFQYGTTTSYGHTTANQTKTGNTYQNVSANISGLTGSTTYHFRIVATNSAGTSYGGDRTFTTH